MVTPITLLVNTSFVVNVVAFTSMDPRRTGTVMIAELKTKSSSCHIHCRTCS
jgi:hypothetical protein